MAHECFGAVCIEVRRIGPAWGSSRSHVTARSFQQSSRWTTMVVNRAHKATGPDSGTDYYFFPSKSCGTPHVT